MRYRLRTLLILMAIGPPILAEGWIVGQSVVAKYLTVRPDSWEDVGGPGAIDSFGGIMCSFAVAETTDEEEVASEQEAND